MTTTHAPEQEGRTRIQRAIRAGILAAVAVIVVCGAGAAISWWQLQDLRDLRSLQQTNAQVTGEDYRRRIPDFIEVRYQADGQLTVASIPGDSDYDVGDTTRVAYVPGDPERVRLVDGWEPAYTTWLEYGAIGLVAIAIAGL